MMNSIGYKYCFLSSQLAAHQTESTEPAEKVFGKRHKASSIPRAWRWGLHFFPSFDAHEVLKVFVFVFVFFPPGWQATICCPSCWTWSSLEESSGSVTCNHLSQQMGCYSKTSSELLEPFSSFVQLVCRSSESPWDPFFPFMSFILFPSFSPLHIRVIGSGLPLFLTW